MVRQHKSGIDSMERGWLNWPIYQSKTLNPPRKSLGILQVCLVKSMGYTEVTSRESSILLELRLLRCTLGAPAFQSSKDGLALEKLHIEQEQQQSQPGDRLAHLMAGIELLVQLVESGEYARALASQPVGMLVGDADSAQFAEGPAACFSHLEARIAAFLGGRVPELLGSDVSLSAEELQARSMLGIAVGIAALFSFIQANKTGPEMDGPVFPLQAVWSHVRVVESAWNGWANRELMVDGCDLLGKFSFPQYLILAKLLLVAPTESISTVGGHGEPVTKTWWACRTLLAHQHILAERSASLLGLLQPLTIHLVDRFGTLEKVEGLGWKESLCPGESKLIVSAALLEAGLVEHAYSHVDKARHYFDQAKQACDLHLSVTGVLGFRTIHQVDPKAQMVLIAETLASKRERDTLDPSNDTHNYSSLQKPRPEQSDILLAPRVDNRVEGAGIHTGADAEISPQKVLTAIEQALVLSECLYIQKNSPDDELKSWEMAPFMEAVDAQQSSPQMVQAWCILLRIQWERQRHRTQERSLSMMEHLVEEVRKGSTKVSQRMSYAFCVSFPTISALLKEYAEMMVACGLVGEALRMFEELELWNNLIDCFSLLGKKAAASDLIQERLKVEPNDPRLWCSLGDVTLNEECYLKAWEVSNQRFARAQRSLGRAAYNRVDYKKSIDHWNAALALNPLFPDGWFALGSAGLKAKELDLAVQAFTRAVQLDPDNGECWNNLAALNMHRRKHKEAFKAFEQALKYKRGSWQLWENFAQVAIEVGEFGRAAEAVSNVLNLSDGKRVDLISLTKLVEEVEARGICADDRVSSQPRLEETGSRDARPASEERSEGQPFKHTQLLFQIVGRLLTRVVGGGNGGGEVYGLLARWHKLKGDLAMSAEARLKETRAYQGNNWQQSKDSFQKFARASLELCELYLQLSTTNGAGKRELSTARMHLSNTIKQAAERFQGTDDYLALEKCLATVQGRLQELQASCQ